MVQIDWFCTNLSTNRVANDRENNKILWEVIRKQQKKRTPEKVYK